jgi:hypothetical protein
MAGQEINAKIQIMTMFRIGISMVALHQGERGGGCRRRGDLNDLRIVYNALRYQYILITADAVILGNRDALARLGLRVMTDAEAVNLVEQAIQGATPRLEKTQPPRASRLVKLISAKVLSCHP